MKGFGREPSREDTDVVMKRVGAQIADVILMGIVFLVFWFGLAVVGMAIDAATGVEDGIAPVLSGIGFLLGAAFWIGYPFVLEAAWNGKTVGKRLFGIKAVTVGGDPVGVGSVLIRNLPSPFALNPFAYLVALLSIATSDKSQRLFDRVAGTVVVREPTDETER